MRQHLPKISVFLIACGLLAVAPTAQAAIATWVSGTGTDAGNCPSTAPCKTLQFAHDQTRGGGSINVLSSGNFGPLTITRRSASWPKGSRPSSSARPAARP